ncbi:glycosyltransferase family 4 protein [Caldibacillus thermolactis]|uniref:Glycosyltransferase family 4 protein n=1 Tax=Pallidibacillus thermolactis TaxID=251051 RepID=A0ABT2WDQ0_9BACI|nr:glycosyltransferase family 4 protein [Pallidibacillus thermolactis]MCU9593811.1 glycosyltransferase family 4 protein [Pallidibacillus thermolactis]MED1673968.1 glycosyltransferase family 4 protein [Pallidibacillus thermolactis subsp. kokeshiiformis]
MNILFVYYIPSGGVETLNRQRSTALKAINIHSHFLYYEKRRDLINKHDGPIFITNKDDEIKKILDAGNYEVIIVISDFQALPRLRKLGYKGKIIMEIQGYGPKEVARRTLKNVRPLVKQYANGFLNPKTPHIDQLLEEFYPDIPKFRFNNCFDTSKFSYIQTNIHPNPIIAWIGRIEENKNWSEFLHIGARLIHEYNPNLELYIFEDPTIGDPNDRKRFESLIDQLNIRKNLTRHENIPNSQMAEFFSKIGDSGGFLCSTSKVEGSPYSLLEALSCKCPVLTTDSDGVRSSIIHNQTGKYYQLGNINHAVQQALELLTNHTLREHIRSKGQLYVQKHFNPKLYSQNFKNMLLQLGIKV